jgi:hypothetical protein
MLAIKLDYLPPVAPPYTTICRESTAQLPCAARGEGAMPEPKFSKLE